MKDWGVIRPALTSLLIGFTVFVITGITWRLGSLQEPELWFYDHFVWKHSNPTITDPRIVLVKLREKDIESLDYPLRDKVLSQVLEKIESGAPVAIGIDLYRDLPEPRDGSESAILNQTFLRYPNIISIFLFGTEQNPFGGIPPPKVLQADSSRYGFNDFPDVKTVRRAYLCLPNSYQFDSISWKLAQWYLAFVGISPTAEGDNIRIGKTTISPWQSNDGGYVNDAPGGYAFMQDFRGPPDFKTFSIGEVLALGDPSVFKNKIVLIGIDAGSNNDTFTTPITEVLGLSREPGVTIHAQVVNQLLRAAIDGDQPTSSFSQRFEWLWMAVWFLCGVAVAFYTRSHVVFASVVSLGVVIIVLWGWIFFLHGYWVLVFAPLICFLVSSMLVKSYIANFEDQQRANLMKLFSQHVSPEIAEEIWSQRELFLQGGRPAAQRQVVTVLFTDLKNYSTISEKMTPNELIAWVNECQSALGRHVGKNGGIINCYMGDGMMAVFGVPVPRTTETDRARDAMNAVQCALGMTAEIRRMNARWEAEGKPIGGLRVGIYTGEAMTGMVGGDHLAYSVIGDTVNTASRLESVDKEGTMTGGSADCRILIGALTYRYVKDRFPAQYVDKIQLKGKMETTDFYKVLDSIGKVEQSNSEPQ